MSHTLNRGLNYNKSQDLVEKLYKLYKEHKSTTKTTFESARRQSIVSYAHTHTHGNEHIQQVTVTDESFVHN